MLNQLNTIRNALERIAHIEMPSEIPPEASVWYITSQQQRDAALDALPIVNGVIETLSITVEGGQ